MARNILQARVSSRGQIALPKAVRDQLGLTEGMRLTVKVEGEEVILRKAPEGNWRQWDGRFRGSNLLADLAAERGRELEHDRKRP